MIRSWKVNLFEDYEDLDFEVLYEDPVSGGYCLQSITAMPDGKYVYQVYDAKDVRIGEWRSVINCLDMSFEDFYDDSNFDVMLSYLDLITTDNEEDDDYDFTRSINSNDYDDYEFDFQRYARPSYSIYTYTEPKKSTGFLDKLNKSNTLVIHCEDRSTDMLSQVYEGKNWDVLRDGNIDKNELHQLLESHERIVMLGHGTSGGLINKQGWGSTIGDAEAPYLKNKKLFVIWCNADGYFKKHGIGNGQFITKNVPSEVWECRAAGCGNITANLMLENITYWSKLCSDVVETCLNGNVKSGVDYVRKHYLEKYGNHPVTIYNADSTEVLGTNIALPKYTFKGKKLTVQDYPVSNFDEEAFLLNPTPLAKDCPTTSK